MLKKKLIVNLLLCLLIPCMLPAQEALKSVEEDYYDFLALQGLAERPVLNYRTLSDSVWPVDEDASHLWQGQNMGTWKSLYGDIRMRTYGPELFMSVNSTAPYGQNDGVLWQGRGLNALLKGGVRFEGYGAELTLMPNFSFSQNASFDIMPSWYDSEYGYFWGYAHNIGADAPQRFGDKSFFDFDFGDTEIRYTWKTLTIGFGAQAIWLGPSYINSILHSNNAPAYPKFDIGLRRQRINIPWIDDWYLGDIEMRLWTGHLTESNFFDNNDSNNYTMIHGFTFAYAPSFLSGLTLFANRVCLVPWAWENIKYIFPVASNTIEDQKASFGFSWIFPQVSLEIYGELGVDDYLAAGNNVRYPFHTMVYTVGLKKVIPILPVKNIYGELLLEWNSLEMSQNIQLSNTYSPYFHHQLTHGYTNRGQWLGVGTGWGGNSQYIEFKLYYPKGTSSFFIHRNNPDNNFIYREAVLNPSSAELREKFYKSWKTNFIIGINTKHFFMDTFILGGGMAYNFTMNPNYYFKDEIWHNFSLNLFFKWSM